MIILSTHGFVCVNSTRALDVWRKEEKEYLLCICYVVEVGASQVAQRYRIHLPMQETQETWVRFLVWKITE